jgi:hypothetical protein
MMVVDVIIVDVDAAVAASTVASLFIVVAVVVGRASYESNGSKIRVGTKFFSIILYTLLPPTVKNFNTVRRSK